MTKTIPLVLLVTALVLAIGGDVVVLVEGDFEIPPLAYYDGREYKPVHVSYVGD
ncbi:hypothetical protein [Pyrobaculum ferrireducens]|uniref:Uncharacterized protein n=1 Tax=Pyrobaculum ferrireducens TaxID=1104324 RepID=G7VAS4_9CREN|nr:hypothetical protein [Pyrobaculum ferrireducens]AET33502.1 hypothetical protein P186_2110 [Pyrobaculum ferrireducens]